MCVLEQNLFLKDTTPIHRLEFSQILNIWRSELWPNRTSEIKPASLINHHGVIDLELKKYQPSFFGIFVDHELAAIVSGMQTSQSHYRSRGIWVNPRCRGLGLGRSLIDNLCTQTKAAGCRVLWTMPRKAAMPFYLKCGFVASGTIDQFEYGPHFLAEKILS